MPKFFLTNKAVDDLSSIWNFTYDKWSEVQADKYYQTLIESCQQIAEDPNLGKNYEGITSQLLGVKVKRHIIFFRRLENGLTEITRILHERMDLKSRISE